MIRRNDLKDILYRASVDASKPAADEVWGDVLANLDEQMPVKKKKRRFLFIFFLLSGLTLFSGIWILSGDHASPAIHMADQTNEQQGSVTTDNSNSNEKAISGVNPDNTGHTYANGSTDGISARHKVETFAGEYLHARKGNFTQRDQHAALSDNHISAGIPAGEDHIFETLMVMHKRDIPYEPFIEGLYLYNDFGRNHSFAGLTAGQDTGNSLRKKDKDTAKQRDIPDNIDPKRHFAIGGTIGYAFNNFTSRENRSSSGFINGAYQVYKQMGVNLYCRIPVTRLYQLQPEIGVEPYSTDIQINYRTPGQSIFTRYNLKRMVYSQFGLSNYVEIRRNLHVIGGFYYSYALPVYGAQLDRVNQEPNKTEQVLSSTFERKDFRKDVFGLRRSDYGVSAGLEYQMRKITGSLRVYRGFTDVTPETPTMYHNFGLSVRLGYHFEFRRKQMN